MKIKKSLLSAVGAMAIVLGFSACSEDWGQMDPEAGNQINPTRQVVVKYNFEPSAEDETGLASFDQTNRVCEVVKDDSLGSNVLHLDSAGAVKVTNPFTSVKLQNGAAISFFVKVDSTELDRPLIAFGNGSENEEIFYFTPNGQMVYSKPGQLESLNLNENDPATAETGMLTPGKWHFVALQITETGYQFYVDSCKSISGAATKTSETDFSYKSLINFINRAPYLYIGTTQIGDQHHGVCFDDLSLIRNQMETSDWAKKPGTPSAEDDDNVFKYVIYVNEDGKPAENIGSSDCSAGWWTQFSDYYRMPAGSTLHLKFTNHTSGSGNWNNWNLCVATDDVRNGENYGEHFVLRSDLYGWGGTASTYNAANITSEGYDDWDAFRANMEGAEVEITLQRVADEIYLTAVATCPNGKVYTEKYHQTIGTDVVRAFLIVDGSYLEMDTDNCTIQVPSTIETKEIGTADCTAGWWTVFSDYFQIPAASTLKLGFTNHTSGSGNWNNWNLCISTDDERNGENYAEHFVIRSDLYGWGGTASTYNAANITNEGYDDWDAFRANMEGAEVEITIERSADELYMTAVATCSNNKTYTEKYHQTVGQDVVRAFLIADGSYLVMDADKCSLTMPVY